MAKSPLILAALAKDAVPQLDFVQAEPMSRGYGHRFDSALLTASDGNHFVIRQARSASAELTLDTELVVLRALAPFRAHFPFEITKLVGETHDARGKRALLFTYVYGESPDFARIRANSPFVTSMANALNAIHSLPLSVVENNGLPSYTPEATVRELVGDLDRAAQTGRVPALLLNRWERALEDVNLWRFQPTVIHGEANSANFLEIDEAVSSVLGWENLRIGDPAQDLSWLHGHGSADFSYSTTLEYERMRGGVDENLRARAQLYSEMELALYLMGALRTGDPQEVADAENFLAGLVESIESGAVSPIGPKPLGTDAFLGGAEFGSSSGFMGDEATFGNAPVIPATMASPAGFVDVAQSVVSADPDFDLPEFLRLGVEDRDPAEVDPRSANIFKPVVDDSYNHRNLFGVTGEIPVVSGERTEPIQIVSDDATAPIPVVEEIQKPGSESTELF